MFRVVYNPSSVPAVADRDGRTVPGRSWAAVTAADVEDAIAAGRLVAAEPREGDDLDPAFVAAQERAAAMNERAEKLDGMTGKQLQKLADSAGIDPDSDDLVRELALANIDIPAGRSRSRTDRTDPDEEES